MARLRSWLPSLIWRDVTFYFLIGTAVMIGALNGGGRLFPGMGLPRFVWPAALLLVAGDFVWVYCIPKDQVDESHPPQIIAILVAAAIHLMATFEW